MQVTGGSNAEASQQIIHLLNWHYVPFDAFKADLVTGDPSWTDAEIAKEHGAFLGEVEQIQQEQIRLLRRLIRDHGLRYVYLEGLTDDNRDQFLKSIEQMRAFEQHLPAGESGIELLMVDEHRHQTLLVGAVGGCCWWTIRSRFWLLRMRMHTKRPIPSARARFC